jgi:hypothetical protein
MIRSETASVGGLFHLETGLPVIKWQWERLVPPGVDAIQFLHEVRIVIHAQFHDGDD